MSEIWVFLIDLIHDTYSIVKAPKAVEKMLEGVESAQLALNIAVKKTVSQENILDMLTFTNLTTLPARMAREKSLNIEYKGVISGWVRGSFMEVDQDPEENPAQILYVY